LSLMSEHEVRAIHRHGANEASTPVEASNESTTRP